MRSGQLLESPARMTPDEWVTVIGSEYLASYIPAGGAAVKFAAASTAAVRGEVRDSLAAAANAHGSNSRCSTLPTSDST